MTASRCNGAVTSQVGIVGRPTALLADKVLQLVVAGQRLDLVGELLLPVEQSGHRGALQAGDAVPLVVGIGDGPVTETVGDAAGAVRVPPPVRLHAVGTGTQSVQVRSDNRTTGQRTTDNEQRTTDNGQRSVGTGQALDREVLNQLYPPFTELTKTGTHESADVICDNVNLSILSGPIFVII